MILKEGKEKVARGPWRCAGEEKCVEVVVHVHDILQPTVGEACGFGEWESL